MRFISTSLSRILHQTAILAGIGLTPTLVPAQDVPALPTTATTAAEAGLTADGVSTQRARATPTFIFYWENDYFGGTDRNYTNGAKFAWLSADLTDWGRSGWQRTFLEALPFVNRPYAQRNLGTALAQHMYTPRDTARANPDPTDRPYAGWTYLEFSFLAKTDVVADTIAVQLGMVGPHSYAGQLQRFIHRVTDNPEPAGWDYQLSDEFGLNIAWERKWRTYTRVVSRSVQANPTSPAATTAAALGPSHWGIDFIPHFGLVAGNVSTFANAGATARFGYNLPSDFGVNMIRPAGVASSPIDDLDPRVQGNSWSFFVFGGIDGRAVARDIFLDGNTFADSRSVEKEPFVADFSYGAGFVRGKFQLTFTQVLRTREFEMQTGAPSKFGSLTFSWTF